jgi:hemerythrin-like domain-containing protein
MMKLIEDLTLEHKKILFLLEQVENRLPSEKNVSFWDPYAFNDVLCALELLLQEHHRREEEILFARLAKFSRLTEGGPMCTHYMGVRIGSDPVARLENAMKETFGTFARPVLAPEMEALIEKNSPLSIPLEEHKAGAAAMRAMKKLVEAFLRGDTLAEISLSRLGRLYVNMLRLHIEKEDHCLFKIVEVNQIVVD